MKLDCGCCVVRTWEANDLESLVRHANNFNVWINLRDRFPHPYTAEDGRRWLSHCAEQKRPSDFAIDVGGESVGGIGFVVGDDICRCAAEIGYWLGESFWNRGIVTVAVEAVTRYAIDEHNLARVFALPFSGNAASRRVLEKAGYSFEGTLRQSGVKNGALIDQAVYAFLPAQLAAR